MLADGNLDRAAALVKGAQQSGAVPEAQITKWRNEINRRQDDARQKRLVDLAQERIRDGRLVGRRRQREGLPRTAEGPRALRRERLSSASSRDLGGAFMRKAREAALANQGPEVDRWLPRPSPSA